MKEAYTWAETCGTFEINVVLNQPPPHFAIQTISLANLLYILPVNCVLHTQLHPSRVTEYSGENKVSFPSNVYRIALG